MMLWWLTVAVTDGKVDCTHSDFVLHLLRPLHSLLSFKYKVLGYSPAASFDQSTRRISNLPFSTSKPLQTCTFLRPVLYSPYHS